MNKNSRLKSPIVALTLALATVSCGAPDSPEPSGSPVDDIATRLGTSPGIPVLGMLPEFSLTDQSGTAYGMHELRGSVWIAGFIFTRCTGVCPKLTSRMLGLQKDLQKSGSWADVRLVSFSVDPEHDTPESLKRYASNAGADAEHWRFLTGERRAIRKLIRQGFGLPAEDDRAEASVPIIQSRQLVLVDRAGRIRGYYDGLESESRDELVEHLETVRAEPRPVWIPDQALRPTWLEERRSEQLAAAGDYRTFHDFGFTDRRPESGIGFVHRFVPDLGKDLKLTHYDHGNGVAVADVDGDGRLDLYLTTQLGGNQLWRNLGAGRFEDVTARAGVSLADRISVAPAFGDVDNDGDPDLFVTTVRGGNVLFENDGTGVFADISSQAGVDHVGHSSGSAFFDYDGDGLLDLFVTNVGRYTTDEEGSGGYWVSYDVTFDGHLKPDRFERSLLYRNLGDNRFEEVSEATGLVEDGWNGDAHPADFNQDGFPDLYLIDMQGDDAFYQNQGGVRFVEQPREMFPASPFGSMGISVFDFENDGLMDTYIVDMHADMFSSVMFERFIPGKEKAKLPIGDRPPLQYLGTDGDHVLGNAFYRNEGDGRFTEVSDEIGAETYWPWGPSHGDLNADGYQDVFIASGMNFPFRYGINSVLLNERGERFVDAEFVVGVEPRRGGRTSTPWFALDCAGEDGMHQLCEGRTGRIMVWAAMGSRSSVIFDLDADGDQDIVVLEFGSEPQVLVSDLSERRPVRWLQVRLVGTESNRSGIGARVTVRSGDRSYTRVNDGKSGYLAQSDFPLYFGLDDAEQVDRIDVRWPSGNLQVVDGPIEVNGRIDITER